MEPWMFGTGMAAFFRDTAAKRARIIQATGGIKVTISDEAWSSRQHRVMKREALLKLLEEFANVEEFLADFIGMQMFARQAGLHM
jgi:hypothetical protein